MKDIIVSTKPLQFINARNMIQGFNNEKRYTLIIMDAFKGALEFTNIIRQYDDTWFDVLFLRKRVELYYYLIKMNIANLYIDSDMSTVLSIIVKIRKFAVFTYEEGWGSYSSMVYKNPSYMQKTIDKLLGNSGVLNDSKWLSGCYLYYPDLFRYLRPESHVKVYGFKYGFVEYLFKEKNLFDRLFECSIPDFIINGGRRVLLYLTSWKINPVIIDDINNVKKDFDIVIVKPHPHIKETVSVENCIVLNTHTIAEYVILELLSSKKDLTIYHEDSTSVLYFQNHIESKNFGGGEGNYNDISRLIRNNSKKIKS